MAEDVVSPAADSALVVLSGGQDSTTCLYWALDRFDGKSVQTLTFDYGQRHNIELDSARAIAALAGVPNTVLPIDTFAALGGDSLTDHAIDVDSLDSQISGLPNSFVPGRNLVFLTFAAAFAYQRGIRNIVTGVAQTDYSGYPDCREDTLNALQAALQKGMESPFRLHTPLMHLSKKQTVLLAERLGAVPALALSHTCYNNRRPPCGDCPACELRAKGFAQAGIADPLLSAP